MPVVTVSSKGQVVIPREIRGRIGIRQGSKLEVELEDGAVVMRPVKAAARGWQDWRGAFAGAGLTRLLAAEHAAERRRDGQPRR
jgi:AbrB family looped-hinge helix DNA binding protein